MRRAPPRPSGSKSRRQSARTSGGYRAQRIADLIVPADGIIIVSGEYNHSIPPALSNLLDHFLEEWFWKPSAIVCYSAGSFGGVRAAMQLRMMLGELGMPSIPSIFPIPRVQDAFDEEGTPSDPSTRDRARKLWVELEWYACALREARRRPPERSECEAQKLVGSAR